MSRQFGPMHNLFLLLKIFNTVITVVIFAAVGFLSCAFFLGNRETHHGLKQHLVGSFFLRFGAFALFGIALSFLPFLINALIHWRASSPMGNAYWFALKAATVSAVGALGGTVIFFSH